MKFENLYAGLGVPKFVGGIDIEWAATKKERCLRIQSDGQIVCFINFDVLLQAHQERKGGHESKSYEGEETQKGN